MPSRFSENMTMRQARAMLWEASLATPSLPNNLGCRLAAHLSQEKHAGKRVYVVNIFDRSPAWINPRYQKGYVRDSLRVAVADAVCWIEDRTPELHAMNDKVCAAILTIQPFRADILP